MRLCPELVHPVPGCEVMCFRRVVSLVWLVVCIVLVLRGAMAASIDAEGLVDWDKFKELVKGPRFTEL